MRRRYLSFVPDTPPTSGRSHAGCLLGKNDLNMIVLVVTEHELEERVASVAKILGQTIGDPWANRPRTRRNRTPIVHHGPMGQLVHNDLDRNGTHIVER